MPSISGALPNLVSFAVNESPKDGGGLDSLFAGHPRLEALSLGRSRLADLRPLAGLHLRTLGLSGGLTSLAGSEALATKLDHLMLDSAPNLTSLDGIEALTSLGVISISGLRNIAALDWVAALPRLRMLDAFDQKLIDSLKPLAGHPSLEFVSFGRVKDLDLRPLTQLPRLRVVQTGNYRWNLPLSDFPMLGSFARDDPTRREYYTLRNW